MSIIICPGIHEPDLTESFRVGLLDLVSNSSVSQKPANILVYPGKDLLVLSAFHILQFLRVSVAHTSLREAALLYETLRERQGSVTTPTTKCYPELVEGLSDRRRYRLGNQLKSPVIFIGFSAGVVGAIGAAYLWQLLGGHVKAFIAIDGWGVPLQGNFPIHRMSHDYFTHWSSCLLGSGQDNFYAEPAVDHLSIWKSPQTVQGWWVDSSIGLFPPKGHLTAAEFLLMLLKRYEAN